MSQSMVTKADPRRMRPFEGQPREEFDEQGISDLAASMKERGQIEPVLVRRVLDDPDCDYEIVDGERRWRSAKRMCWAWLDVVISNVGPGDAQFMHAVVKNCSRRDLTPIEKARAVRKVWHMARFANLPHADRERAVASVFGSSPTWVDTQMKLSDLAPGVQSLVESKELAASTAVILAPIKDRQEQTETAQRIANSGMRGNGKVGAAQLAASRHRRPPQASPGRRARDEGRQLHELAARIKESAEQVLALDPHRIAQAFVAREDDRIRTISKVDTAIAILMRVKSALLRVGKAAG